MMASGTKWDDLAPRLVSALVMLAVGIFAIVQGGWWFTALIVIACGVMGWELIRMTAPDEHSNQFQAGGMIAVTLVLLLLVPFYFTLPVICAAAFVLMGLTKQHRIPVFLFAVTFLVAGLTIVGLRVGQAGLGLILWLVLVVVATDVAGYFAGRIIGGSKFWPRISPKKTLVRCDRRLAGRSDCRLGIWRRNWRGQRRRVCR